MPIQESASVCSSVMREDCQTCPPLLDKNEASLRLRQKEVLAYHYLCEVFRAQGHLTSEKLKLLKEVAAALYIPDVRHRAECSLVLGNPELKAIADSLAGPGSEIEWRKESAERLPIVKPDRVSTAGLMLADAVVMAIQDDLRQLINNNDNTVLEKTIKLRSTLLEQDFVEPERAKKSAVSELESNVKIKIEEETEVFVKEEEEVKDEDTSSSISSDSDDSQTKKEEKIEPDPQKSEVSKEEEDASLMPPPPPVIIIPSPTHPFPKLPSPTYHSPPNLSPTLLSQTHPSSLPSSPTSPVINVPPPSDVTVLETTAPDTLEIPEIVETPLSNTTGLSEEEAKAHAEFLSSLPPLVVVPPPDPSETSALTSPSSLVLSPGMSIQIRDDTKKRKRSVSQSKDILGAASPAKTIALSSYSKVTPMMVTATSAVTQTQVKVTPIISRAKMTTTPQAQKVIIVSNTPTSTNPVLQRSLSVPVGSLGLPIIRANQPRFQSVPVPTTCGGSVRPKIVTVPAKCRAKGSSMVNLQLKNAITLKQDNVTVVDTNVKRLPGPAKILPKPSGSMFIVNTGQGAHKLTSAVGGSREGGKQNVVIVQKGANQRTLTLSNSNKDLMQKLMSKKCVVIQSSKVVPKTLSPRPSPPPPQSQTSPVITTTGNTVVLDLSQEQYRQSFHGGSTVRDILQAAGVIFQPNSAGTETSQVTTGEGEWLPVETSKSLSLEEVSLPLGQAESFVTLDEAVEMLEEPNADGCLVSQGGELCPVTITSDQLSSGSLAVETEKTEPTTSQIVVEALPSEVASDLECISQSFVPHKDGAVTIQHSNIDVPANMSLEDYSSQQIENHNFN